MFCSLKIKVRNNKVTVVTGIKYLLEYATSLFTIGMPIFSCAIYSYESLQLCEHAF